VFRIDPITTGGAIDVDFYISDDYTMYRKALEKYLKEEGFAQIADTIVIKFNNQLWSVSGNL
jgi:hypothetical protein